ncbi:MAG TPA: hypothetical protein VKW06_08435 [Candidatus Angelobacter sp.]|nr:hypothetical protein [Candidatus Angelobacter sp.]
MSAFVVDGKQVSYQEYVKVEVERERRESARLWELKQTALLLVQKIGEAYREYEQFLEDHPELAMQMPEGQIPNQKLYEQLRENLGRANDAPRCMYVKPDGVRCGSPRLKGGELCYTHQRMERARSLRVRMPHLEDANSIQVAIMEVHRALLDHQIGSKDAGLLLYGLQTAAANIGKCTFHKNAGEMVLEDTEAKVEEKAVPVDTPERHEKYRYENIDPDHRAELMELGDRIDRRHAEKEKARAARMQLEAGVEVRKPCLGEGT